MGSFSWNKADDLTQIENVAHGTSFKFLIPKEFGGGFIKDKYQDYGLLGRKENNEPKYDMYELLALWNLPLKDIQYNGSFELLKEIDEFTDFNRGLGIDIGCYDEDIRRLTYPLKLVSASCNLSYEEIFKPSYGDPDQGFCARKRS